MRSRVKASWRTKILLLIALVLSGVIAANEVREREARRAERPRPAAAPAPVQRDGIIEIELGP